MKAFVSRRISAPTMPARTPHRWRIEQPAGYDDRSRARIRIQLAKGGYRLVVAQAIWPELTLWLSAISCQLSAPSHELPSRERVV